MFTSLRRSPPMRSWNRPLLFIVACAIYFAGRAPFIGQWDSFDYLKQIVTHRLSDLGFGRPVFIGFNIVLWELLQKVFRLVPLQVEEVTMVEIILLGALGVLVFAGLARQCLPPPAGRLAVLALLLSPMYAVYSGFVMTEIPMLVALIAAALILWPSAPRHQILRDLSAGVMFGIAVGMREQAATMGAAYLWILWTRRPGCSERVRSIAAFGAAALVVSAGPVVALYLYDPAAFARRMQVLMRAVPTGQEHFWKNVQASLIWTLAVCPAAWLAMLGAGIHHWLQKRRRIREAGGARRQFLEADGKAGAARISAPISGIVCCLILPVAALWRDADVQIHPRYAMVALPAALIFCASLYARWAVSERAATTWVLVNLVVFGIAQVGIQPVRHLQAEKREYARVVRDAVPGEGLLIPGGYSPIMDYYRVLGERPQWQILWSGWGWEGKTAEAAVRSAWARHVPVYLCQGPAGWWYFEDEWLDLYFIFRHSRKDEVAPGLFRVQPDY